MILHGRGKHGKLDVIMIASNENYLHISRFEARDKTQISLAVVALVRSEA